MPRASSGRRGDAAASRRPSRVERGQIPDDDGSFEMIQSRQSLIDLWDRAMRAKEEGRPGPFCPAGPENDEAGAAETAGKTARSVTSFGILFAK